MPLLSHAMSRHTCNHCSMQQDGWRLKCACDGGPKRDLPVPPAMMADDSPAPGRCTPASPGPAPAARSPTRVRWPPSASPRHSAVRCCARAHHSHLGSSRAQPAWTAVQAQVIPVSEQVCEVWEDSVGGRRAGWRLTPGGQGERRVGRGSGRTFDPRVRPPDLTPHSSYVCGAQGHS